MIDVVFRSVGILFLNFSLRLVDGFVVLRAGRGAASFSGVDGEYLFLCISAEFLSRATPRVKRPLQKLTRPRLSTLLHPFSNSCPGYTSAAR